MSVQTIIAKRYAQAFLNLYIQKLTDVDLVNVGAAIDFLAKNRSILALLKVPHITAEDKIAALEQIIIIKQGLPTVFKKLIVVLVHHKRAALLLETLEQLTQLYNAHKHVELYKISSSHALDESDLQALQKFLAQKTGHLVYYTYTIDPRLIAGVRMQSDQRLWEYSIKKQLASLPKDIYGN